MRGWRAGLAVVVALGALAVTRGSEAESRPQVTFMGVQQLPAGPRLFVHLTQAPERITTERGKGRVMLTLLETDIGAKNNRYPLDLSAFDGPVVRAQLNPRDSDVTLELQLRSDVIVTHKLQKRADSTVVLQVEFH
jgi:hypothetical protein